MRTYLSSKEQDTIKIAKQFGSKLEGGQIICLYGSLGVGKTVFVKGIAKALGINKQINSPSYTILKIYPVPKENFKMAHFDFYRLDEDNQTYPPADLKDYFNKDYLVLIEWPERVERFLPKNDRRINIVLDRVDENIRKIKIDNDISN